jgi:hypothetical protein
MLKQLKPVSGNSRLFRGRATRKRSQSVRLLRLESLEARTLFASVGQDVAEIVGVPLQVTGLDGAGGTSEFSQAMFFGRGGGGIGGMLAGGTGIGGILGGGGGIGGILGGIYGSQAPAALPATLTERVAGGPADGLELRQAASARAEDGASLSNGLRPLPMILGTNAAAVDQAFADRTGQSEVVRSPDLEPYFWWPDDWIEDFIPDW